MRSKYSNHLHHKSSFLPMLCSKPSIKDVTLPKWSEVRSSSISSGDPLSPKVGCMGQVKRNNRVAGFPTPFHRFAGAGAGSVKTSDENTIKYFKLKKLFSSKNLLTPTSTAAATISSSNSGGEEMIVDGSNSISLVDLDPPLPVIKRVQQRNEGSDAGNLWKRRSGGVALKSLQVQQIQLPNNQYLQATSV